MQDVDAEGLRRGPEPEIIVEGSATAPTDTAEFAVTLTDNKKTKKMITKIHITERTSDMWMSARELTPAWRELTIKTLKEEFPGAEIRIDIRQNERGSMDTSVEYDNENSENSSNDDELVRVGEVCERCWTAVTRKI